MIAPVIVMAVILERYIARGVLTGAVKGLIAHALPMGVPSWLPRAHAHHDGGVASMALLIGMNSGSSFDGIDAVLLEIELGPDGQPVRPRYVDGLAYDWPKEVEALDLPAFENRTTIFELTRINYIAGAVYAKACLALIEQTGIDPATVLAIGVDGQTIYQEPPDRPRILELPEHPDLVDLWMDGPYAAGIFIGESAVIATATGIPTVTHFRPADHALGGTGAPMMQYLDWVSFRDIGPILTLNIGGIANCHLANKDRADMRAFDTGPGNVMIDHSMHALYGRGYDKDGEVAASGQIHPEMLEFLLDHPFYARKPPRSAWRLDFGSAWADRMLDDLEAPAARGHHRDPHPVHADVDHEGRDRARSATSRASTR